MAYCAYVCTLKNVRPHPNADRMLLAEVSCGGNTVCVDLNATEGQQGAYFPVDGQLSEEFCKVNDLVRRKDEKGNPAGGYLEPDKRNIRAIMLRGEKSDGLFMPLSAFDYTGAKLSVGDSITVLNGHEICQKYIPKTNKEARTSAGGAGTRVRRRAKRSIAPTFFEHADTEQLQYHMGDIRAGDEVEITLKMHGTSQRTGYHKILQEDVYETHNPFARIAFALIPKKSQLFQKMVDKYAEPVYDWGYVTGTRRTVLEDFDKPGFYDTNNFREGPANAFKNKLWKGETVYYEVVGFQGNGTPIMASVANSKIRDKEFSKQYGKETVFSYGCTPDGSNGLQDDFYVYRMTMTNEDGDVVEYTPDFMRYRCDQMGVKTVIPFWKGTIPNDTYAPPTEKDKEVGYLNGGKISAGEYLMEIAEQYYDGPDPVGKTHVREGVVCRILNRPKFTAYKHKNFSFKILEGIIKDEANAPDMEEAEEAFKDEGESV